MIGYPVRTANVFMSIELEAFEYYKDVVDASIKAVYDVDLQFEKIKQLKLKADSDYRRFNSIALGHMQYTKVLNKLNGMTQHLA